MRLRRALDLVSDALPAFSFFCLQKNEVLVLLNQIDSRTFECQVGDAKGTVQNSYIKVITPLSNYSHHDANPAAQVTKEHQNRIYSWILLIKQVYSYLVHITE